MVGSQLDYDPEIQDVLTWKKSSDTWRLGSGGVDDGLNRRFIPRSTLEAKFKAPLKVEGLLHALFGKSNDPLPDADYIRNRYLRPFVILLCVGQGHMIYHFVEHESLQDPHLPFRALPQGFPSSTTCNLWETFKREQWGFCAMDLEYNMSYQLSTDDILPIIHKERLGEGGSAVTHRITVHPDYDSLDPPGRLTSNYDQRHKGVYVVKTYRTAEAKTYFDTERNAFRSLKKAGRPPPNIIGFYGSFQRGQCFNLVLEYADSGNLEEYMKKVPPPSSTEDTILFWDSFFDVTHGLLTIHGTQENNPKEPQILLGWHHDVKPSNILVKRRSATSLYDCHFKLADLGLSHFKRHVGPRQGATDRDAFGTHAYGAPETCRMDRALEGENLEVKQEVDIWSMGCVYSEVTTWVGHGWNKVDEYRRRRRQEFKEKTSTDGECFHDGSNMLVTVEQIHAETLSNRRVSDHVTPSVLEQLVPSMMIVGGSRLTAKFIFESSKRIINTAKTKGDKGTHKITHHGKDHAAFEGGQPQMPPNLPPGHDVGTRDDSPYTAERSHDLGETPSNGSTPNGRPFSPTSQYENSFFRGHNPNNRSGDFGEPPFTPTPPGRVFTAPQQSLGPVHQNRLPLTTQNRGQMEPLYNNRFNPIVEDDSGKVDVDQTIARRETRNFPLQDQPGSSDPRANISANDQPAKGLAIQSQPHDGLVASHADPPHTVSKQKRHPVLSIEEALQWKTDKEHGRYRKLDNEDLLEELKGRDHAFLIDNAESMDAHWSQVKRVFGLLSYMVRDCDPNGLDLYFTNTSETFKSGNMYTLMGELGRRTPKGLPDMRSRFGSIIEKYQSKFGKRKFSSFFRESDPRKLSLYVLTDAVWQPKIDLTTTVRTLIRSLEDHKLTNKQIGIQFIRFGNNPGSIQRLEKLDSGLNLDLDIIDHTPADGNVWKMLLGPVNDWFDDD